MIAVVGEKTAFSVDFSVDNVILVGNNTPHASRQICAPWGVTFFAGWPNEIQ